MRVVCTGSREWDDWETVRRELRKLPPSTVVMHGAARGLDRIVDWLCRNELGLPVLPFPADWIRYGNSAGPRRNRQMRDEGKPTHGLAFLQTHLPCRGTRGCIEILRAGRIPVRVIGDPEAISDW